MAPLAPPVSPALIIKDKFCDNIGFHNRYIKNESTIVYDTSDGGSYIEAALYSWSISDDQLLHTCARRLREKLNSADYVDWPPTVEEVASAEEPEALLQKFLVWLNDLAEKPNGNFNDGSIVTIASFISYLITGKRTLSKMKLGLTLHRLTRSREIIDILYKLGISISYNDVLNLHSTWAMYKSNKDKCPTEIAYDTPGVAVMDNDDFRDDTLTGADTSHRTNVMFVQQLSLKNDDEDQYRLN